MTEADWLHGTDFAAHALFVADRLSPRRQRLLAAGFCRAVSHLFDLAEMFEALMVIDHYADGMASPGAVERVRFRCRAIATESYEAYRNSVDSVDSAEPRDLRAYVRSRLAWALAYAANTPLGLPSVGTSAAEAAVSARIGAGPLDPVDSDESKAAAAEQNRAMRAVVWEVGGNPFRPVKFQNEWRTDTAVSLAQSMYDSREFSAMPILADALQDAGCDSEDVLSHCRGHEPGGALTHVRGCWVLDMVLEKG
jgi:hypothetical protein